MKIFFKTLTLTLALVLSASSFTASANDCKETVKKICLTFDYMGDFVSQMTDISQLDNMDMSKAVEKTGWNDEDEEGCLDYVLTKEDKDALAESIDRFCDKIVTKVCALINNALPRSAVEAQINPVGAKLKEELKNSVTLGDFIGKMNSFAL